ncbi:MAG TPA: hypothetical protein VGG89_11175 [Candidatus Baltobacteraceae bacterium]
MASTSLTGIFAPGSPALVESLRTLVLEPKRSVLPGETVRAEFSFSNFGGASATGVRVRFSHPQGVSHVPEDDLVDDRPIAGEGHLVDANGTLIGDLEPNSQRKVSCSFRVSDPIEDGTELVFQAALVSDQTALLASNIERVIVRSRPMLQNTSTLVTLSAPDKPRPGDAVSVRATIVNTGSASAHDVVALLPAPEHTTYVPRSARIDGRVVLGIEGEPFDYDSATVVTEKLAPGQSVTIEYQATIDSPLPDSTRIKAVGGLGSRECNEFPIASAEIYVASPVDFSGEETALTVLCDDAVAPGMRIPIAMRAVNAGTGAAEFVAISFALPPGLVYAPGSASVDGQPVSDESIPGLTFSIGTLASNRVVEVGLAATVAVPPPGGELTLPIEAALRWKGGERDFARRLSVRVSPRFNRARNYVEADHGVAHARDDVRFLAHVYNDGTAPERNVRLRVIPGVHLDDVRIAEATDEPLPYREPLDLGIVPPHHERVFVISARVASKVPDRSNVTLGVVLEHDGGAIDLGTSTVVVRSRPQVFRESVAWELASNEPLRPHRFVDVLVRFTNAGSDVLRDARLTLTLPPELALERAIDARRDREGLVFGDVAAERTHEARLTLRLLRPVPHDRPLTLEGWLRGKGISPVQFPPLEVPTHAQPDFAGAQLMAAPSDSVNAGEHVYYEIRLRNEGDGPADRLLVRVIPTNLAVYVPSSTTINGLALADEAGASILWSNRGLVLADVNPNVELRIRWEVSVIAPLSAGTTLETRAVLEWGDGQNIALAAPPLRVQAQPTLGESTIGVPLSVARIFPAESAAAYEPPPLPPQFELPDPEVALTAPALEEPPPRAIAEVIAEQADRLEATAPLAAIAPIAAAGGPMLYIDFAADRLAHTIKLLERSEAGGLVQHLFALRMLFPENAVAASPALSSAFTNTSRAVRAPLERFFVRLRMPRLTITGKDLEDRDSRAALRGLLDELVLASPQDALAPPAGIVRIEGSIDADKVRALMPELDTAPLGAVNPWIINAHLLGTSVLHDGTRSEALAAYREEITRVFTVLSELPIDEFHRVLTTSVNRGLDDSFTGVLDALRGAAHLAVD